MPQPDRQRWLKVDPSVRRALGPLATAGIEIAYNTGATVTMPPIEGFSPTVEIQTINLEQSMANILAHPSPQELAAWEGLTEPEIRAAVETYVRDKAAADGLEVR